MSLSRFLILAVSFVANVKADPPKCRCTPAQWHGVVASVNPVLHGISLPSFDLTNNTLSYDYTNKRTNAQLTVTHSGQEKPQTTRIITLYEQHIQYTLFEHEGIPTCTRLRVEDMEEACIREGSTYLGDLVLGMQLKVSGFLTEVQNELAAVTLITDECIPVAETLAEIKGEPTLNDSRIDAILYSNVETGVNGASFDVPVFCNHAKEEPRNLNSKYTSAEKNKSGNMFDFVRGLLMRRNQPRS